MTNRLIRKVQPEGLQRAHQQHLCISFPPQHLKTMVEINSDDDPQPVIQGHYSYDGNGFQILNIRENTFLNSARFTSPNKRGLRKSTARQNQICDKAKEEEGEESLVVGELWFLFLKSAIERGQICE